MAASGLQCQKEYGNAKTIHGKFIKWCKQGVFNEIHKKMLDFYKQKKPISWIAIDGSHHKSPFAEWGGKNPTDRARNGIKVHLLASSERCSLELYIWSIQPT